MTYYYAVNGQQNGPVSDDDLRGMVAAGSIAADTLVWREEMAEWQPFSVVLGGGPNAIVQCSVCRKPFPQDQTIQYGTATVCAGCKPQLMQGLREGAATPGVMELATVGSRFGAKVMDNLLMFAVAKLIDLPIQSAFAVNPTDFAAAMRLTGLLYIVNTILGVTYQAVFLHWRGQTPGKIAMKIRVVTPDGGTLSWGKAIGRPFAEILSGCTIMIGYLMAFWDPEKRTLHDAWPARA